MGPAGPGPGPGRQGLYATFSFGGDFVERVMFFLQQVFIFIEKSIFSSKSAPG